jgi:hypothetical protein
MQRDIGAHGEHVIEEVGWGKRGLSIVNGSKDGRLLAARPLCCYMLAEIDLALIKVSQENWDMRVPLFSLAPLVS